jgi:hypothetical protein
MKTFRGYLREAKTNPAWTQSLSTMLFDLPRKELTDAKIPISPSIFSRIWPEAIRSTAFHATDQDGLKKLKGLQGGKRTVSAFYNANMGIVIDGIKTGGGYIVEIEGDVLIAMPDDISSQPDKSGRRWTDMGTMERVGKALGPNSKFYNDLYEMMCDVFMKYKEPIIKSFSVQKPQISSINREWSMLGEDADGKTKSLIIKDYIDGMEKIMKKHSGTLRKVFTDYVKSRELKSDPDSGEKAAWDELLVNKFKIKKVHVGEEYAPDFEGDKDIHGLPIQTWDSNNDLAKHISSIVKKKR